jgi:hypothetical protein
MKIEKKINIITKEYKIDEMNNKNEIKWKQYGIKPNKGVTIKT